MPGEEEDYDSYEDQEEGLEDILDDLGEYTEEPDEEVEETYEEEYVEEEEPEEEYEPEPEEPPKREKKAVGIETSMDPTLDETAKIGPISGRMVDLVLILFGILMVVFFMATGLYEGTDKIQSLEMGWLLFLGLLGLTLVVLLHVFVSSNIAKGDALARLDNREAYSAAVEKYNMALKIDRRSKKAWTCKGLAMRMISHDESNLMESLRYHNTALKIDPKYGVAWVNKGNVLFNLGKSEEALLCYDKAIDLDPDYTVAWVNKGEMLVKLGQRDEAQRCLDRARSLVE
jgi:tetratricopeptide (TPR) repeat protein